MIMFKKRQLKSCFFLLKVKNMETVEEIIGLDDINELCDYLVTCDYPYYEELRECFELLLLTGCRIRELFEIGRWSHVENDIYTVQPQKGNDLRTIELDSRFSDFKDAISGQYKPFLGRTVSQFENLFDKIKTWNFLRTGSRVFSSYIFRYRYVKSDAASGMSISEIAEDMGYCCVSTPTAYLDAVIYKNFDVAPVPSVTIGSQVWMAENLAIDDGLGGIFYPDGDIDNVADYGLLYTWDAAMRVAATVEGWHLPTDAEWTTLTDYLGGEMVAGGKLKETGTTHWTSPNTGATNETGFTALPGGLRFENGTFSRIGTLGYWWCATDINAASAWYSRISNTSVSVYYGSNSKMRAFSVRLVKNS